MTSEPARVLRVIARLNVGGPAQQAILLTATLAERYPTVLVTGLVAPGEAEMDALAMRHGVEITRIPELGRSVRPLDDLRALWRLWRLCRRVRPCIVHTHTAKAGTLGRIAALLAGVPIRVHTFHGHVFHGYFGRAKTGVFLAIERLLARFTTRIVAISPIQAKELGAYLRLKSHRIAVVPLGLDLARFSPDEGDGSARLAFRQAIGVGESDVVISVVGRLTAIKNHALLLRVLTRLVQRHPSLLLVFVGGGEDEVPLRRLAEELGVAPRVRFAGWWDDLPAVYRGTDIVALSSLNEGTPVCLIEALASGRPVVATAVGGVADVLDHGRFGALVPSGDEVAFAAAIERVLERRREPEEVVTVAEEVRRRYGIARLTADIAALYDQLRREAGASVSVVALVSMLGASAVVQARAQRVPVGDPLEDYTRVLGILGRAAPEAFTNRPVAAARVFAGIADSSHPWTGQFPSDGRVLQWDRPALRIGWNSRFPWGQNDGAVWPGRGLTAELGWGGAVRLGPVEITLWPYVIYTGNGAFPLAPLAPTSQSSPFSTPWHRNLHGAQIDLPQRLGPTSYWTLDPGQSSLRVDAGVATVGVATENLWWGPGIRNAIVMSNNAPGFAHAFVGTRRPVDLGIGRLDAEVVWGNLRESQYFDTVSTNDNRFVTGMVATFEPKPLPGLYLGATRLFYEYAPPGGIGLRDLLLVFKGVFKESQATSTDPSGNDLRDQLLSLFARWVFPESGFEAYVEWARNDHSANLRDLMGEPEHSQGYTIGFQRAFPASGGRIVRLMGELTHLERDVSKGGREIMPYYVHETVRQGYTNLGQVVGAGLGPGGNSQALSADVFTRWGRVGAHFERRIVDNDAYWGNASSPRIDSITGVPAYLRHDVVLSGDISALLFHSGWAVEVLLGYTRELNRYYVYQNDVGNITLMLAVRRWGLAHSLRSSGTGVLLP